MYTLQCSDPASLQQVDVDPWYKLPAKGVDQLNRFATYQVRSNNWGITNKKRAFKFSLHFLKTNINPVKH